MNNRTPKDKSFHLIIRNNQYFINFCLRDRISLEFIFFILFFVFQNFTVKGQNIEQLSSFNYLETIVECKGKQDNEMNNKIGKAFELYNFIKIALRKMKYSNKL